jgi:hypothetical protein
MKKNLYFAIALVAMVGGYLDAADEVSVQNNSPWGVNFNYTSHCMFGTRFRGDPIPLKPGERYMKNHYNCWFNEVDVNIPEAGQSVRIDRAFSNGFSLVIETDPDSPSRARVRHNP